MYNVSIQLCRYFRQYSDYNLVNYFVYLYSELLILTLIFTPRLYSLETKKALASSDKN